MTTELTVGTASDAATGRGPMRPPTEHAANDDAGRGRGDGPGDDGVDHGRSPPRPRASATSRSSRRSCRRHQALRADRRRSSTGRSRPGKIVQAWAYNGMVPGPRIDLAGRRHGRGRDHQRAADRHRHPLARHRRPQRPGRRRPDHPGARHAAARPTPTGSPSTEPAIGMYHAHAHGDQAIPNGLFGTMYVGDDARAGRAHRLGHRDPRRPRPIAQDIPMVVNDAGAIGLTPQRQELPGHRPARRRRGRLGHGHLLQRGPAGPPDAPPRLRADRRTPRTANRSTSPTPPTPSSSAPASATPCCSTPTSPAPGSGTATSSTTSSPTTGMFGMVTALVVQ